MNGQNYRGYLLAAHPLRQDLNLKKGVVLILDHDASGAIGLQINKSFLNDVTFATVMRNVNLHTDFDQPLYNGGAESTNRIHVIHSLDWYTTNTTKVTNTIGVSHDLSVLAAISKNEGPEYFRVVAGFTRWLPGHLEGEVLGEEPWNISHTWNLAPATVETVFEYDELDQWHQVTGNSAKLQVSSWF